MGAGREGRSTRTTGRFAVHVQTLDERVGSSSTQFLKELTSPKHLLNSGAAPGAAQLRRTHWRSGQCTLVSPPAEPSLGTRRPRPRSARLAPWDLGRWWRAILGGDPPGRAACLAVHSSRSTPGMGRGAQFPPTSSKIRPRPSLAHAQLLTFTQKTPHAHVCSGLG